MMVSNRELPDAILVEGWPETIHTVLASGSLPITLNE
jgi:hypothetical protein